ncbi:hypothetical protein GY32_03945 [Escherichia coli]|nr:hypothetical protein JQ59_23530 [Escherichia coli]KGT07322.1 hypothetical protein GY32_03945 [Escherichia coli]
MEYQVLQVRYTRQPPLLHKQLFQKQTLLKHIRDEPLHYNNQYYSTCIHLLHQFLYIVYIVQLISAVAIQVLSFQQKPKNNLLEKVKPR